MSSGDTNTSNRRERDLSLPVEENGLLEYAKDTISSLLSIYGYEDSISSEVLQELKPKQTETVEKVEVSSTNDPGDNKDITRSSLTGKWFETSSITVNDKVHEGQHSNTKESMMDSDYISNENADFSMSKNTVNDSCLVSSGPGMQQKSITLEDVHHGKYGSSDTQQTVQITSGTLVDVKYYNNQADRLSSCAKVTGDIIDCRDKIINSNQLGKVIEGITVSPIELEIIDGEINPVTGSVEYVQESMTNSSRNTNISTVHAAVGMSYTSIENTGMEGKGIIGSADSNFVTEEREKVIDKGVEVNDKYVDIQSGGDSDDVSYVINIDSDAIKLSESSSEKNAVCNKVERNHVKMVHSGWNEKAEGECMKSEYKRVWVEKGDLESKNQDLLVAEDNQCIKSNDPISKKYVEKTEVMGVLLSNSTQFGKVMDQGNDGISKRNDSRDGQVEVKLSDKAKCLKEGAQGNVVVDDDDDDEVTITCISPPVGKRNEGSSTSFVEQDSTSFGIVHHAIPPPPLKPEKPLTPYLRYKRKILPSVKREFPKLPESDLNLIISNQWNMIKEEEKQEFHEEYAKEKAEYQKQLKKYYFTPEYKAWVEAKNTVENAMSCRIKLPKLTEKTLPEEENSSADQAKKTGQCNWCKSIGTLSNFSANVQGKEIYCTGLCSQKCFKEASMKICNLENGGNAVAKILNNGVNQSEETKSPSPNTTSVQVSSGSVSPTSGMISNFIWKQYLQETNAQAAPWQCFKQSQKPLPNKFNKGMKLEAQDPRQGGAVCVATVVGIFGPRLRLRFDGSDTSSDIWRLTDSEDIHPVNWAEKNGAMLHPPVGFRWDVGKFPEFLSKTLNDAIVADADIFNAPPTAPEENLFQPGMKIEAVDRVNPALICVATVTEVKDDRLHVEFDGYKGSGYWCKFDDRDIFPAGWCFSNGYPLQPPGKKAYNSVREKTSSSTPRIPTRSTVDSSSRNTTVTESKTPSSPLSSQQQMDSELRQQLLTVNVYLNSECSPGPYLNPSKLAKLPKFYSGKGVSVMQNVIEDIIQCGYSPKVVFGFLRPVARTTSCVITAQFDGVQYRCCLPNIEQTSSFWRTLEQFCDNLRCCENLLSATSVTTPCLKCSKGAPYPFSTIGIKRAAASSSSSVSSPSPLVSTAQGRGAISSTVTTIGSSLAHVSVNGDTPNSKRNKLDSSPIEINTPPRNWSVEEVAKFIEQTDLCEHAALFKSNEIDGKALLLLKRDIVITYMGFKLGPAVKLLEIVDELRDIQKSIQ